MGRDDINESQDSFVDKHPMNDICIGNEDDKIRELMLEIEEKYDKTKMIKHVFALDQHLPMMDYEATDYRKNKEP